MFISVGVILSSCVRSATGGNDFGWRSLLFAQFGMLMCAALYASRQLCLKRKFNWFDRAKISLGVASTSYGVYLDRSSMVDLFDAERVKWTREIYAQLGKLVPLDGSIQHNPTLTSKLPVEILALSYSHRRDAVTEKVLEIAGPQLADVDEYNKVSADIVGLFDNLSPLEAQKIRARNKINVLLVKTRTRSGRVNPAGCGSFRSSPRMHMRAPCECKIFDRHKSFLVRSVQVLLKLKL